jgi:cell division septal protein FtsQ
MLHFRYLLIFFYSINTFAQLNIEVTFEDPIEFESQLKFIEGLDDIDSVKSLKNALENQEWIDTYILNKVPFDNNIEVYISSKKPLFNLNNEFYVDYDLDQFSYSASNINYLRVNGDISNLSDIINLIEFVKQLDNNIFNKLELIEYSHIFGWLIVLDKTEIKLGKEISNKKLKLLEETIEYLDINNKIPSMIDLRYKDGVAIKNG